MTNDEREKAKAEVEAFLQILQERYGITGSDLRWLARYHRSLEKYGDLTAKALATSIITIAIGGLALAIWEGFKHLLGK